MELLIEVPGKWEVDALTSFTDSGEFVPKFTVNDEAKEWAAIASTCLEESEEYYFRKIYRGEDFCFKGLTETAFSPYWAH